MAKQKNIITAGGNVAQTEQPHTIILSAPRRGGVDIATYLSSLRLAERVDWASRVKLYDIYEDLLTTDGHLAAVVNKRRSAILSQRIECRHNGKIDEVMQEQVESPWFLRLLGDVWDSILYDQTLIQMRREGKWLDYDLIPRKHVDATKRLIRRRQDDTIGVAWDAYEDLLFVGRERGFGLLAKIMPYAIYKRDCIANWAQYAERYGMPLTEGEYDGWNTEARDKMAKDLFNLGSSGIFLHPAGTKITFHESTQKGGSSELFKSLVGFCNEEMSKIILGNTLTTQASETGTQALGTVQKRGEESLNAMDVRFILNVLNYEMMEMLGGFGFETAGREFFFAQPDALDLASRITIDVALKNEIGLPISDDYFYEKYGIEKPLNYEALKRGTSATEQVTDAEPKTKMDEAKEQEPSATKKRERNFLNALADFFGEAPHAGASDW